MGDRASKTERPLPSQNLASSFTETGKAMIFKTAPGGITRDFDSWVDLEIPPVIRCATCLRLDCEGCRKPTHGRAQLSWERGDGSLARRLWATTRQSVAVGSSGMGLDSRHTLAALGFAVSAELLAAASLVGALALLATLALPAGLLSLLADVQVWSLLGLLTMGLCLFMVVVHLVWGLALELTLVLGGLRHQFRRSLSFALYACGWDLLTSPLGCALAVLGLGPKAGMAEVRKAMRVPRPAVAHYVTETRGLDPSRAAACVLLSFLAAVGFTLLLVGLVFWAVVRSFDFGWLS